MEQRKVIEDLRKDYEEIVRELREKKGSEYHKKFSTDSIHKLDNLFSLFNKRLDYVKEIIKSCDSLICKEEKENLRTIEKTICRLFEEFEEKKLHLDLKEYNTESTEAVLCLIGQYDSYENLKEAMIKLYKNDSSVIYALKKIIGIHIEHIEGIPGKENFLWPLTVIQNTATSVIGCFWRNPPEDKTIRCARKLLEDLSKTNSDKEEEKMEAKENTSLLNEKRM